MKQTDDAAFFAIGSANGRNEKLMAKTPGAPILRKYLQHAEFQFTADEEPRAGIGAAGAE